MSDDFWKKMDEEMDEAARKRRAKSKEEARAKKIQAKKERYYREAEEFQKNFNKFYSGSGSDQDSKHSYSDGDGSSLFERYSAGNSNNYKDEIANQYGKHYNGYDNLNLEHKLNRGLGVDPHQTAHVKDKVNNHRFDPSAPRIRIHLDNNWTTQTETANQSNRILGGGSNRSFNGGRNNGGSSLKGRF